MEADRTERDNLSRDFPVRVPEMIELYEKWEKRVQEITGRTKPAVRECRCGIL